MCVCVSTKQSVECFDVSQDSSASVYMKDAFTFTASTMQPTVGLDSP